MEFLDLIKKRYSVRAYKSDPVEEYKLQQILEAACLAPTACNLQPFKFIVIFTKGREEELKRIYRQDWFVQAPIIVCACAIREQAWVRRDHISYAYVDVAIAMDHLILAATNVGLGTCWIAAFNPVAAREVLELKPSLEPVAFTPIGYALEEPGLKSRKPLNEIIKYHDQKLA